MGCSFSASQGTPDGDDTIVDGDKPGSWTDDSNEGFSTGTTNDASIDAGRLTSRGYAVGGLHAKAYKVRLLDNQNETFAMALGRIPANGVAGERVGLNVSDDWGYGHPTGLGLRNQSDQFSVIFEGEIRLDSGSQQLALVADDYGIVELDLGAGFTRVVAARYDANGNAMIDVPRAGWYPIRAVIAEDSFTAQFKLLLNGSNLPPAQQRCRVDQLQGWHVQGFNEYLPNTADAFATSLHPALLDEDWQYSTPDSDVIAQGNYDRFMLRYAGQIKIEAAGSYQFGLAVQDNGDARRLWIDGDLVGGKWGDTPAMAPRTLTAGWHDIVVDFAEWNAGLAGIKLTLDAAPAGVPLGVVPATMIRPVLRRGRIVGSYGDPNYVTVNDQQSASASMRLVASGATVESLYTEYVNLQPRANEMTCGVVRPDGSVESLGRPQSNYNSTEFNSNRKGSAGMLVSPNDASTWKLQCTDDVANQNSAFRQSFLAIEYFGGAAPPFASTFSFVSKAHTVAGLVGITSIDVAPHGALPSDATITVDVRAAADETSLAQAAWQPLVAGTPLPTTGPALQYRVTIASDGWNQIEIDQIKLNYRFK